ncbi:MAG: hypothetical protein ACLP01_27335 [Solirubrobacteraceae bacterium]
MMRRLALAAWVLVGAALSAGPAVAASFTWSGADTATAWSKAANWAGNAAPRSTSTINTLSFPQLTSGACAPASPLATCYQSNNDVPDLNVDQLSIHDSAYRITGYKLTLRRGLSTDGPDEYGPALLIAPVTLAHEQAWDLGSGLILGSALSGHYALSVENPVELGLSGDNEVGPISITGGAVDFDGADLNSANGDAVTLTDSVLDVYGVSAAMGAFSSVRSDVLLGLPGAGLGAVSLRVARASLDSGSSLEMKLGSKLSSTGRIALGNAILGLVPTEHTPICDVRSVGTVYTLVSTRGSLSGGFGNARQGTVLSDGCDEYRIAYLRTATPKTVSATLLGSPTTTTLVAEPNPAMANRPVTLRATVTSPEEPGTLSGETVTFESDRVTIPGCGAVSLRYTEASDYIASCRTSFSVGAGPVKVALRAMFTRAPGSDELASSGTTTLTLS